MYENLRKMRVELNVPVLELSQLLDLKTIAAYYKKENGTVKFSLVEAKKIADRMDKSIEEVFFKDELAEMQK